jgi:hypothetical protein
VSRNSAELLQEMLAPIKTNTDKTGVHETFVTDLADQCYRLVDRGFCKQRHARRSCARLCYR